MKISDKVFVNGAILTKDLEKILKECKEDKLKHVCIGEIKKLVEKDIIEFVPF